MTARDGMQRLFDRYVAAYRAGDAEGCAAAFTVDAEIISPYGPPACGRTAIAALHRDWVDGDVSGKQVLVREAGASGDLGWCLADFHESAKTAEGCSLNVLERQPDGSWLIRMCSLNETFAGDG